MPKTDSKTYIVNDQSTETDALDFTPFVETLADIIQTGDTPSQNAAEKMTEATLKWLNITKAKNEVLCVFDINETTECLLIVRLIIFL